jgi:hypothetical protein
VGFSQESSKLPPRQVLFRIHAVTFGNIGRFPRQRASTLRLAAGNVGKKVFVTRFCPSQIRRSQSAFQFNAGIPQKWE